MYKSKIGIIATELFQISLITYIVLLLMEALSKGYVSNIFNLNIMLATVLLSGIIMALPIAEKTILNQWEIIDLTFIKLRLQLNIKKHITENEFYYILICGLGSGALVFFKIVDLGVIAVLISIITAVIIFLLSYLIFTSRNNDEI